MPPVSRIRGRSGVSSLPDSLRRLAFPSLPAAISTRCDNRNDSEPVVIVSQTLAQRMFPNQDAVNRHVYWTDPVLQFFAGTDAEKARFLAPHRIVGVTADIDDGHVVPEPTLTIYTPFEEGLTVWRSPLHSHRCKSLCAGPVGHAHHSRHVRRSARRARRHSRRHSCRSAHAGPFELAGVWRLRGCRAGDCRGGRRRRAGVFGERADARIRHPAGPRIGAAATSQGRDRERAP